MKTITKILPLLITIGACTNDFSQQIKQYELKYHNTNIKQFITIDAPTPFYANDSINICQAQLEQTKAYLINIQQQLIDTLNKQIAKAEENLYKAKSKEMKKAISDGINSLNAKKITALQVIEAYQHTPKQTSLMPLISYIEKYAINPDSIIGHTLTCQFKGQEGLLPLTSIKRTYLIQNNNIVGDIKP